MQSDFTADDLATVLEIVLAQADAIEELQAQVSQLSGSRLAQTVEKLSVRLAQLEQAQASQCSEVQSRLLSLEVPQMQAHYGVGPSRGRPACE